MSAYRMGLCTCPDRDTALRLAGELVDAGLAACVNVLPGLTSVYRWEGARQVDEEVLLLFKTREGVWDRVEARLQAAHPYDVPEIIAVPITAGLAGYLNWVDEMTQVAD